MKHLLEELDILGFGKSKFVMDRVFYSEENINGLYHDHIKFLVGGKLSLSFIRKNLDEIYEEIRMFRNFEESTHTYGYTLPQLLDKLDVIECFEDPGHLLRVGEILTKKQEIYKALGVPTPSSL